MTWALQAIEREAMARAQRELSLRGTDGFTVSGMTVPEIVSLIAAARFARDEMRRRGFHLIDEADKGDGKLGRMTRVLDEALSAHWAAE